MLQVKDNVENNVYNSNTRSDYIRDEQFWRMITQIYSKDIAALSDLIAIFDLLVKQMHPD
jgi:hypothetical protein